MRPSIASVCGNRKNPTFKLQAIGLSLLAFIGTPAIAASDSHYGLTISGKPTHNVKFSGGVFTAVGDNAVLNIADLKNALTSAPATVTTGNGSGGAHKGDLHIDAPLSWTSASGLTLDAYHSIFFNRPFMVAGPAPLILKTNDGASGGEIFFRNKGRVAFASTVNSLTVDGRKYRLVNDIAALARAVANKPDGYYALANNYDAKIDGIYSSSPIAAVFTGSFDGLGNTISNLSVHDQGSANVGFFSKVDGTVQNLVLANVDIQGGSGTDSKVGGLAGLNLRVGRLLLDSTTGFVSAGGGSAVGGLVGYSQGSIQLSHSAASVRSRSHNGAIGGLAGFAQGDVDSSFATGEVIGPDRSSVGGLIGASLKVQVTNSYSTGDVSGGAPSVAGGFAGGFGTSNSHFTLISSAYSIGKVSGGIGSEVGGFAGANNYKIGFANCYWNVTTSGRNNGLGHGKDPNIVGLTTQQFQSELPAGFDPNIWAENPKINSGYPYLIANPPAK